MINPIPILYYTTFTTICQASLKSIVGRFCINLQSSTMHPCLSCLNTRFPITYWLVIPADSMTHCEWYVAVFPIPLSIPLLFPLYSLPHCWVPLFHSDFWLGFHLLSLAVHPYGSRSYMLGGLTPFTLNRNNYITFTENVKPSFENSLTEYDHATCLWSLCIVEHDNRSPRHPKSSRIGFRSLTSRILQQLQTSNRLT